MSSELDIKQALRGFQKVIDLGVKQGNRFFYKGMFASSDFDGYNILLTDEKVSLEIFFHNKYDLQFPNKIALQEFFERLKMIDKIKKEK